MKKRYKSYKEKQSDHVSLIEILQVFTLLDIKRDTIEGLLMKHDKAGTVCTVLPVGRPYQ